MQNANAKTRRGLMPPDLDANWWFIWTVLEQELKNLQARLMELLGEEFCETLSYKVFYTQRLSPRTLTWDCASKEGCSKYPLSENKMKPMGKTGSNERE